MFNKITIIGVGLIGGSIGQAAQKRHLAKEIVGVCRRSSSCKKAVKYRAVDRATLSLEEGLRDAELVIIATPVGRIVDIAGEVIKHAKNEVILIDVGSTKEIVVREIEKMTPPNVKFVGTHPMAGSEKGGVENANDRLFENSICIITKTKKTDGNAFNTVRKFWSAVGAICKILTPEKHDRYVSFVSHLPHVAAVALTLSAERQSLEYASTGFRDTTRIALSNPTLWQDIFKTNKQALLRSIYGYIKTLKNIHHSIKNNDDTSLANYLTKARRVRESLRWRDRFKK